MSGVDRNQPADRDEAHRHIPHSRPISQPVDLVSLAAELREVETPLADLAADALDQLRTELAKTQADLDTWKQARESAVTQTWELHGEVGRLRAQVQAVTSLTDQPDPETT